MNAAETVQAAMERLTRLRSKASGPEPWAINRYGVHSAGYQIVERGDFASSDAHWSDEDAALVVTLYATIDAQIDLLRHTLEFVGSTPGAASHEGPVIELARAILGNQADD